MSLQFDGLSNIDQANVVHCARVLLRRPLLRPDGPEGDLLPLVYRHRSVLQEMFAHLLGYRLVVERRFARLCKTGPAGGPSRGEPGLSPRGHAYVALTLAALTGAGRQVLLSRLVSDIRAAAAEAGIEVVDDQTDRRALTAALRHLVALGVIAETEGTVSADSQEEALITVNTDLLGQLLVGPLGEAGSPVELVELAAGQGSAEQAVRRRLVEDPVVLYQDLPAEQAAWLRKHGERESATLERYFNLVTEFRAEGVLVTDPESYLTDLVFPGASTVSRITLLALPELLSRTQPRPDGKHPINRRLLDEVCQQLVAAYPAAWARQATQDPEQLVDEVVDLLDRTGLLSREGEQWLLSPVAHRWRPHPDAAAAPPEAERPPKPAPQPRSLFDTTDEDGQR
ncbi:TIGR02678 family protein [Saccharopolyspora rectivirgula]|jgi:uncharacterized protein (TIGR02678 family)|uniref:TIGR02678 family protein n=1 Tax=Saccharopolyspora rectivirgula TaxID=28042 RepID=A0A073B248_9PSEU|nr:TIGR02678 family protein [Saccharopolyspora rectivirgula]KEI45367.1 hypothetical protein GU90_04465 [Saccharopolyspora rectivirgula]